MSFNPADVADAIKQIAREEIAPRFGQLAAGEIDTKSGPTDFVTLADRAAEAKLKSALSDIHPDAAFVGEEGVAEDKTLLTLLENNDGPVWIVDPLDGTRNFVQGRKEFGTIVALVENRQITHGWIYAIPDDAMAYAVSGQGFFWRGEKMANPELIDRQLFGYRAVGNIEEPWKSKLLPRMKAHLETDPVHCSAYGYINLALGKRDFALYSRCNPWDHAAGVLMLRELGGHAQYLDDGAPYMPVSTQGRPLLVSGSVHNWNAAERVLMAAQ